MKNRRKFGTFVFFLLLALSSSAFAKLGSPAPTATPTPRAAGTAPKPTATSTPTQVGRASTSQKGSLLIFPLIDVRPENIASTIVDISNDDPQSAVHVECNYVNEKKDRRNFDFFIDLKGTVSWDVLTRTGSIQPAVWPTNGSFAGDPLVGELICFAVNAAGSTQVRFNHLSGTASVVYFNDADAKQPSQSFEYKAWAFTARSVSVPLPPDNSPVGMPGTLVLSGGGNGTYDACPLYLTADFSPSGATGQGNVTTLDNDLSVSICNQDLRQDFIPHYTKLKFNVWNESYNSFSGAWICSDSTFHFGLDPQDTTFVGNEDFTFSTLGTNNARFTVQGIASTQCKPPVTPVASENTGLVGVLNSSIAVGGGGETAEVDEPISGAGAEAGFVLWDPSQPTVPQ